jgi:hypothetical protein
LRNGITPAIGAARLIVALPSSAVVTDVCVLPSGTMPAAIAAPANALQVQAMARAGPRKLQREREWRLNG